MCDSKDFNLGENPGISLQVNVCKSNMTPILLPGIDFRVYAEIILYDNVSTHIVERLITKNFKDRNVKGSQGQKELYDFTDAEIADLVYTTEELVKDFTDVEIKEVNFYKDE